MINTEKTLTEVLAVLKDRGYIEDFNLLEENISYKQDGSGVNLHDIVIDKSYRFTGGNDPDEEAILYALTDTSTGTKGVFVNGYGTYTNSKADEIINRIAVHEDDSDDWCG